MLLLFRRRLSRRTLSKVVGGWDWDRSHSQKPGLGVEFDECVDNGANQHVIDDNISSGAAVGSWRGYQ